MNELRRELLDEGDAPADLSPELRFLASRQASLAALLLDHAELYRQLITRHQAEGTSSELEAIALDAAGNLGTVLQQLRSREDLLAVLVHAPNLDSAPLLVIDQLFYSFVLLSGTCTEEEELALLPPGGIDELLSAKRVRAWLTGLGAGT